MSIDTISIEQFISQHHITLTATWADRNPNMPDSRDMDHWKVTLVRRAAGKRLNPSTCEVETDASKPGKIVARLTTYFSKGFGHNGAEPTADEVLDCLSSDAAGIENARSFENWCGEYGYDTDSRKAEKTFKACDHSAKRLKTFLGNALYERLLWHTERM